MMFGIVVEQNRVASNDVKCDIAILEAAKAIISDEQRMAAIKEYIAKEKERLDSIVSEEYLKAIGAR